MSQNVDDRPRSETAIRAGCSACGQTREFGDMAEAQTFLREHPWHCGERGAPSPGEASGSG